jgi:O-antigen/teichoic acid export membrane protein
MEKKTRALKNFNAEVKERLSVSVVAHFFVYVAGKILMSGISCIMAPLMMILLSPAEYGLVSLLHGSNNVVIACLSLGLPQALTVHYFQASRNDRGAVINSVLCTYCMVSIPIVCLIMVYPWYVQHYLFLTGHYSSLVYAVVLIWFFSFFNDIMLQLLQYHRAAFWFTAIQVFVSVVTALLNILLLAYYHAGVVSVVLVQFALVMVVFCVAVYLYVKSGYYKALNLSFAVHKARELLELGVPFLPGLMSGWLLAVLNRWMLAYYMGLDSAGIYSIADAGGLLIYRLILHPLQGAYGPSLFDAYGDNAKDIRKTEKSNHSVMVLVLVGMGIASVLGYVLFKPLVYMLIPVAYMKSVDCILGILLGYTFLIGAYFVSNFLQFKKKRAIFAAALCIAVLINSVLNCVLIPCYGILGCVCSMAVGCCTYFLVLLMYNCLLLRML